jgi:hypothetical protein
MRLSLFVRADNLPSGAVCTVTYQLMLRSAAAGRVLSAPSHPNYLGHAGGATFVGASQPELSQGVSWELPLGNVASWAAVEATLRELGLVHSDNCLHMATLVMNCG